MFNSGKALLYPTFLTTPSQKITMDLEVDRMSKIKDIINARKKEDKKSKEGGASKKFQSITELDQHRISWKELYDRLEV